MQKIDTLEDEKRKAEHVCDYYMNVNLQYQFSDVEWQKERMKISERISIDFQFNLKSSKIN